ncbi:hypothetical protein CJF31_00003918 [Rutstroemia sp. NJR-2017a BVV2]|nr:hypothetical protein CJF31_00003918 [Rutstroemia sp. NJR-2017a BVV2]
MSEYSHRDLFLKKPRNHKASAINRLQNPRACACRFSPYVTLSYVWGDEQRRQKVGPNLPPTIEDAIHVTLKLGYQYLWVDRYCINQGNDSEEISQIQQMGSIYKNSEFTIIAAAGSDPCYGLPGVSRSRLPQAAVRFGQLELVNPGSVAATVLKHSQWSTRGWTFQEASLSKRRIVFTDEQVYYECNGMYSYESLNVPLEKMHGEGSQILDREYFTTNYRGNSGRIVIFPGEVGYEPLIIFDHISCFSRRTFTYPSDKLIGFLGILKEFETGPHRIRNIWGSPILPNGVDRSTPESYNVTEFLITMIWSCGAAKRIVSLPSWSWVGWDGALNTSDVRYTEGLDQARPATIAVELSTGQILDWSAFHDTYAEVNDLTKLSQFIHISCWTIPLTFTYEAGLRSFTQLLFRDGCRMPWNFSIYDSSFKSDSYTGILLVFHKDLKGIGKTRFMLIFAEVRGRMERVGGDWLSTAAGLYRDGEPVLERKETCPRNYAKGKVPKRGMVRGGMIIWCIPIRH